MVGAETPRWSECITGFSDTASKNILQEQRADPFVWYEKGFIGTRSENRETISSSPSTCAQYMSQQIIRRRISKHLYSAQSHFRPETVCDRDNISFPESICSDCKGREWNHFYLHDTIYIKSLLHLRNDSVSCHICFFSLKTLMCVSVSNTTHCIASPF